MEEFTEIFLKIEEHIQAESTGHRRPANQDKDINICGRHWQADHRKFNTYLNKTNK